MAERVEAAEPTPFTSPVAIGVPVADFLSGFHGEACDEAPKQLRFELHDTETDAVQIVRFLAQLSKGYRSNQCVQRFAQCLVRSTQDNAQRQQFEEVAAWVLQNIVYQADPRGMEYVRSPVQMLREWHQYGRAYGDCDDQVLLLNSLLGALGLATHVVAVKIPDPDTGAMPEAFNHVISQVRIGAGWKDFDPCNKDDPFFKYRSERLTA